MPLNWKPRAALPHFDEPTDILIAAPTVPDVGIDEPILIGIFAAHGLSVENADADCPPDVPWLWVTEAEALDGAFSAPLDDDDVSAALLDAAEAFAGELFGDGLAVPGPTIQRERVACLVKCRCTLGVVEMVEIEAERIEYGLIVGPLTAQIGGRWAMAPQEGVGIYCETEGDLLASGIDESSAHLQLQSLMRAWGGEAEFARRRGFLVAQVGEFEVAA